MFRKTEDKDGRGSWKRISKNSNFFEKVEKVTSFFIFSQHHRARKVVHLPKSKFCELHLSLKRLSVLKMQNLNKLHLLQLLFFHVFVPPSSKSQEIPVTRCGSTVIQEPFLAQNPTNSSILNHMILCKSGKVYLRTTIGLFPVSSIDYSAKLLTVSHTCSSTSNFISPHHLSAGFPPPPSSNSVILLNCSKKVQKISSSSCDNQTQTFDRGCGNLSVKGSFSCLAFDEFESSGKSFYSYKEMNCTHYRRVYRNGERLEMGTQIRFGIPDHVPNPCDQCEKLDGNCGVGLRCICHPRKCKDKVISVGAVLDPSGNIIFSMFLFIAVMGTL